MLERLSVLQKTALVVGIPTTGVLLYFLLRKGDDDDENFGRPKVVSSRQITIEVKVPREVVGAVIGPQGSVIKGIESVTGARVHFKDDIQAEDESRVVLIRGSQASATQAELQVRKIITEQPVMINDTIEVPEKCLGRIIGKNGDSIRGMCRMSRCKIDIPRNEVKSTDPDRKTVVSLRGSKDAIVLAKELIMEKLEAEEAFRCKMAVSAANRPERRKERKTENTDESFQDGSKLHQEQISEKGDGLHFNGQTDVIGNGSCSNGSRHSLELAETSHLTNREYLAVYVSAVEDAGHFWVQVLGSKSTQLDELVEAMTDVYYNENSNQHIGEYLQIGDIVAAPFKGDDSWYRAKVEGIVDNKVNLYYVDFGDRQDQVEMTSILPLRSDFLSLPHQASECFLAKVKPPTPELNFSEKAKRVFEELSYASKWKRVMARIVSYVQTDKGSVPSVELVETNGPKDINIAAELVNQGLAEWCNDSQVSTPKKLSPDNSLANAGSPNSPIVSPKVETS